MGGGQNPNPLFQLLAAEGGITSGRPEVMWVDVWCF
jgi:hypothetical protein